MILRFWLVPLALVLLASSNVRSHSLGELDPTSEEANGKQESSAKQRPPQLNQLEKLKQLLARCTDEAAKAAQNFMKPQRDYFALVSRYHKWYFSYAAFYQSARLHKENDHLAPQDLMALEFSKVDHELYAEMLEKGQLRAQLEEKEFDSASIETVDFLFEALRRLIVRLEAILDEIKSGRKLASLPAAAAESENSNLNANSTESSSPEEEEQEANEAFKESMERLKRITVNSAQGVLSFELMQVSKIAALNALATHFMHAPPEPGTSLSYIAPFISMIGMANTPLVVSYLMSLKIRAAMEIIDGYNPVPKVVTKLSSGLKG